MSYEKKNLQGAKKAAKIIIKANNRSIWKGAGRAGGKTVAQNAFCYSGLWTVKGYVAKNKRFQNLNLFLDYGDNQHRDNSYYIGNGRYRFLL